MTSSRIPQLLKKANLSEKPRVSDADDTYNVEKLHSRLVELSYHHLDTLTTAELSRLLQGRAGEALSFLITHLVGRERAVHIRQELHKLRQLPRHQVRDIFPPDCLVEKVHRTESDVIRTRREVEKKQEELRQLMKTCERQAVETEQMAQHLQETRIKAMRLETLLSEEKIRVARMKKLKDVLNNVRQERAIKSNVNIDDLLNQIRQTTLNSLTSKQQPERMNTSILIQTFTPDNRKIILARLKDVSDRIRLIKGDDTKSAPGDDFLDYLTVCLRHNAELKKLIFMVIEVKLEYEKETPNKGITPNLKHMKGAYSELITPNLLQENVLRSGGPLIPELNLRTERDALFKAISPARVVSIAELDSLRSELCHSELRIDRLLTLFRHLAEDTSRQKQRIADFDEIRRLVEDKGQVLIGYIDVLRRKILETEYHAVDDRINDSKINEFRDVLRLPIGVRPYAVLRSMEDVPKCTERLQTVIASIPTFDTSARKLDMNAQNVVEQCDAQEEKSLALLRRKNEKAERLTHELERDARKFLKEGEALHSGQLGGKGSRKAKP